MSEVTTKFAARKPLAKITDQESSRYVLGSIFITQSDQSDTVWQVATDGRRLAAVESCGTTDRPQLCPIDIWPRKNAECTIELNGDWRNSEKRWTDEKRDGKFPKVSDVCEPVSIADSIEITLNPQFLAELAAAIDDDATDGITLIVPMPEKGRHVDSAIRVHGQIDGRSQFGLLMPMAAETKENIRDWRTEAYNAFCDRIQKVPQWQVDASLDAPECTESTETDSAPETTPETTPEPSAAFANLQETLTEYGYHRSESVPAEPAPKVEDTPRTETRKPNIVF